MSAAEHDRLHEDAGAYLLGALDDDERRVFEQHLERCHVCQDEVERLRVAAEALPRSVGQYEAPPALKASLMKEVYAEARASDGPRRSLAERLGLTGLLRRPGLALAGAGFVLLVGLIAGWGIAQVGDSGTSEARTVAVSVDQSRIGTGRGKLVIAGEDGPARLEVSAMPQPPGDQVYEIWLRRGDRIEPASLFAVDRNGNGTAAVPGSLKGVDQVMVTRERKGGARQPTEAPVLSANT